MPQRWTLSSLLKRNLWIVTGKGGVGKTTVAGALGFLASQYGLNTLLVETHGLTHLGELLRVGSVGYQITKIKKNLSLFQLTPEEAFEEYVLQQIRLKILYNAVFNNRLVRHFIDAAPGLNELLTIGKIWALVEGMGMKRPFDLVIVDAPATGHGLSLLTVPQVVADAVRVGPLKTKSEEILNLLRNPARTLTWLVTLPEEMPVNEAVEMAEKLRTSAKVSLGPVLINCVWPKIFNPAEMEELYRVKFQSPMLEIHQKRLSQSLFYVDKLKSRLDNDHIFELPLVYQTDQPSGIAEQLQKNLDREFKLGK